MSLDPWEAAARQFEPVTTSTHRWDTPGALARHLNDKTVQTPALDVSDAIRELSSKGGRDEDR